MFHHNGNIQGYYVTMTLFIDIGFPSDYWISMECINNILAFKLISQKRTLLGNRKLRALQLLYAIEKQYTSCITLIRINGSHKILIENLIDFNGSKYCTINVLHKNSNQINVDFLDVKIPRRWTVFPLAGKRIFIKSLHQHHA